MIESDPKPIVELMVLPGTKIDGKYFITLFSPVPLFDPEGYDYKHLHKDGTWKRMAGEGAYFDTKEEAEEHLAKSIRAESDRHAEHNAKVRSELLYPGEKE